MVRFDFRSADFAFGFTGFAVLDVLNKAVSRKVKGSHNWWQCVRALARLYRHIANQRKDWHYKVATDLCERFDMIVTETLNLEGNRLGSLCGDCLRRFLANAAVYEA